VLDFSDSPPVFFGKLEVEPDVAKLQTAFELQAEP
jgi:hypothetical protein